MFNQEYSKSPKSLTKNLFLRADTLTDNFDLTNLNSKDTSSDTNFLQKESFDNFYDTIKNEISPQKINDFNKLVVDFNGYINKLSMENNRLKNKVIKSQEKIKSVEKKLMYHEKTRKRIEENINKKMEYEKELLKIKENLIEENSDLKNEVSNLKEMLVKVKSSAQKRVKETLNRNYVEWQNHEKSNMLKLKKCMEKEISERVKKEKNEAEERFKHQLENIRTTILRKETDMKSFYEEKYRTEMKLAEGKLMDQFEYEKQILKRELVQRLKEHKREIDAKAVRDKRSVRLELVEDYEDWIMGKDRLIKQFQNEQQEMLRKIKLLKDEYDGVDSYRSRSSVKSFAEDQNQFLNEIDQKLTYAKMRIGFASNEPSLGNEFYSWVNETSIETDTDFKQSERKESVNNIFNNLDKNGQKIDNKLQEQKNQENHQNDDKVMSSKIGFDFNGSDATFKAKEEGSEKKHIKIEELNELSQSQKKSSCMKLSSQEEIFMNGPRNTREGKSSTESNLRLQKSSELEEESTENKKQVINLMEQSNGIDCLTLSKDRDISSIDQEKWSEQWIKINNAQSHQIQAHPKHSTKSENLISNDQQIAFSKEMMLSKDQVPKSRMQTLDLSQDSPENKKLQLSPNLTNILSSHSFTRTDTMDNGSRHIEKAERLQSKLTRLNSKKKPTLLYEDENSLNHHQISHKGPKERDFEVELKTMENKYKSLLKERDQEITKLMELNTNRDGSSVDTLEKLVKGEIEGKNGLEKPKLKLMENDSENCYTLEDKENFGALGRGGSDEKRVNLVRTFKVEVNDL